ncbi:hypothetical protein [Bacillus sp. PS06]|uniref:hypothetical protein n=1 Tax=Bacillus sp. PS06 TaxID=2764176 RepID=UPI001783CBBA|nr:hypothetical protein [Bacillus sp. PS06]MBD8070167.1 hypothetical protein [Bacillus sp. PS06]
MSTHNKFTLYLLSLVISSFTCFALYKLYETMLVVLETNPEVDNVSVVGIAMFMAPMLLFMFNFIFYLFLYRISIKKYPSHVSSWKILLLSQESPGLNLLRIALYLLCLWTFIDLIGTDPTSLWIILTITLNLMIYGYWVLQTIEERPMKTSSILVK